MHLVPTDLQGMLLCGADHLALSLASTYLSLFFSVRWEGKPTDLHCNDPQISLDISSCEERQIMTKHLICLKKKSSVSIHKYMKM